MDVLIIYLKSLFGYARAKTWLSLFLMVFLGLAQGIGLLLIIPFLSIIGIGSPDDNNEIAEITDTIFQTIGVPANIYTILLVYVVIIGLHAGTKRFHEVLNTRIIYGYTQHLRDRLYGHLCQLNWLSFIKTRQSDITHVLTADLQSVSFATQQLFQFIGAAVIVGIHLGVAFMISLPMSLAALGCGAVFMLLLHSFQKQALRFGDLLRQGMNDMFSAVTEHVRGMKIAKSYHLESQHIRHFSKITHTITEQMVQFSKLNTATRMIYQIGTAFAVAVFLMIGIKILKVPSVDLMVIVFLLTRLLPGFSGLQQNAQRILNAMPSFTAIHDMENEFTSASEVETPRDSGQNSLKPIALHREIQFKGVFFRYNKSLNNWTLKNINMEIPANAMTALTGPSGAGKSTIADLILGLLIPDQGHILIDGQVLNGDTIRRWRDSIGYVPQETFLFHESIRENLLRVAPSATETELTEALQMAAADEFVAHLPNGMDTIAGDRGVRLSGGERQRIALARALLRKPALLLLDEATSALDNENEIRIQNAIEKLHGKLTILVIAHRHSTLKKADHRIEITDGRIVHPDADN